MPITNSGNALNMNKIHNCQKEYQSFSEVVKGAVVNSNIHKKFNAFYPNCAKHLPKKAGRRTKGKSMRKNPGRRSTYSNKKR